MSILVSKRSQLQWLALLAVAVLLPTVGLLWFLGHVVANERLVIQQKLAGLYQDKLTEAGDEAESHLAARLETLRDAQPGSNPYAAFRHLVIEHGAEGLLLWNAQGALAYPAPLTTAGDDASLDHPLALAWQFEFQKKQFEEAATLYASYEDHSDPYVSTAAMLGRTRCLLRLGRVDEAIAQSEKAAFFSPVAPGDIELRMTIQNARLVLLNALKEKGNAQDQEALRQRTIAAIRSDLFNGDLDRRPLPPHQNLFIAKKVLEALGGSSPSALSPSTNAMASQRHTSRERGSSPGKSPQSELELFEQLVAAEGLSIAASESLQPFSGPFDILFQIHVDGRSAYGLKCKTPGGVAMMLMTEKALEQLFASYETAFRDAGVVLRIIDASDNTVLGADIRNEKPFLASSLPASFPGWNVELFMRGDDVFERAARRQITVYIWTGALVILLFLAAAALASLAVGRQIRLNRMKNDFIATVSHELKTPLASMRVLMDTLLEGNIRDENQARQYLRLAAKENERLSRMIDNFLTFSRMERNKQAFVMAESNPADIATDAVDSIQTKYAAHHCHLSVETAENLPRIFADHDALVTVLVNLLDNACKYTGPDKRVGLRVDSDHDTVCFAVLDNGIGLSRRHARRIFDRFYQVDNSLARKAEGSGLGLSIVKFIVEAHKGSVTVESKPGKGSVFYVRIPAGQRNGNSTIPE